MVIWLIVVMIGVILVVYTSLLRADRVKPEWRPLVRFYMFVSSAATLSIMVAYFAGSVAEVRWLFTMLHVLLVIGALISVLVYILVRNKVL